jgi:hypothetical protein
LLTACVLFFTNCDTNEALDIRKLKIYSHSIATAHEGERLKTILHISLSVRKVCMGGLLACKQCHEVMHGVPRDVIGFNERERGNVPDLIDLYRE